MVRRSKSGRVGNTGLEWGNLRRHDEGATELGVSLLFLPVQKYTKSADFLSARAGIGVKWRPHHDEGTLYISCLKFYLYKYQIRVLKWSKKHPNLIKYLSLLSFEGSVSEFRFLDTENHRCILLSDTLSMD